MILLAFFLAPVAYYRLIWSNIMTGINQAVATYRIGFYFVVGNFSAILALWAFDWLGAENVIGLTAVLGVINGVVAFIVIHKREPTLKPSIPLAWESLRYGLAIYVGFIANVVHFKIDQVMINYWMGTEAVGIYAVSVGWAEKLFLLDNAIVSAALYRISSSSARESYALTKRLLKVQLLISGSSGLLLAVLAYPLILTLYGEAYGGAVWPLIVLVPSVVAWSLAKVMSQYISYQRGKKWIPTIFAMSGMLINIFLNLVLIRAYDTTGAALARVISCAFVMALTFVGLRRLGTRD